METTIRNSKGKLLCTATHDMGSWIVGIKRRDVYTFITLYENGNISIMDEQSGKALIKESCIS